MKKSHLIAIYLIIIALTVGIIISREQWLRSKAKKDSSPLINSFQDCVTAGYPIQESYPRKCAVPNGPTFTEQISSTITPGTPTNTSHNDLIVVTEPEYNEYTTPNISSPVTVKGKARGNWYFEASFPVIIEDSNGNVLAQAPAQAQGDWMTNEFVPFEVSLTFPKPTTTSGKIILKKDNPSGLPEHNDQIEIPVLFFAAGVGK